MNLYIENCINLMFCFYIRKKMYIALDSDDDNRDENGGIIYENDLFLQKKN